jgi:hypothetical protein
MVQEHVADITAIARYVRAKCDPELADRNPESIAGCLIRERPSF